jgi:putative transposase
LKEPGIAAAVKQTLILASTKWKLCDVFAWVIMSNHVHLLFEARKEPVAVMCILKSASARAANRILARGGKPFWQAESYDHWVRDKKEFDRIVRYIEWNPVSAGLVARIEDFPWSSATTAQGMAPRHNS